MDAFLIEKFEKQGGHRIETVAGGTYDVGFMTLRRLLQSVAAVSWDLGQAKIMLEETETGGRNRKGEAEQRRLLDKSQRDLGTLNACPTIVPPGWCLSAAE